MFHAPVLVRERLLRSTQALQDASVDYAVIGANAVAYWVGARDEGAIRNTPNVDVLVCRDSLPRVRTALEGASFLLAEQAAEHVSFIDGPGGKLRSAARVWFSGDTVSPNSEPLPSLIHSLPTWPHRVIALPTLVRMKLSAWRTIDRVHLHDLIGVGQLDETWLTRFEFPEVLAERLRQILANPDG
jgi:hypothetical protein